MATLDDAPPTRSAHQDPSVTEMAQLERNMQEALANLNMKTAREYRHSVEIAPTLVTMETPLDRFLRVENYNPEKAALRLALYWKYRHQVFRERALLPMTQTGSGCLSSPEIQLLRRGFFLYFPASPQPILIADYAKIQADSVPSDLVTRCCFYFGTVVASDPQAQTTGITLIHFVTSEPRPAIEFRTEMWNQIRTAFPMKCARTVVCRAFEPWKNEYFLDFLALKLSRMISMGSGTSTEQYSGDSVALTIHNMERAGISRRYIPLKIGGTLDVEQEVADWTRTRLSIEDVLGASPPTLHVARVPHELAVYSTVHSGALIPARRAKNGEALSLHEKRQRGSLYTRRHYHRQKLLLTSLQSQVDTLKSSNESAKRENDRLTDLLRRARALENSVLLQMQLVGEQAPQPWTTLPSLNSNLGKYQFHR